MDYYLKYIPTNQFIINKCLGLIYYTPWLRMSIAASRFTGASRFQKYFFVFAYLVLVTRASILNKEICSNLICSLTVVIGAFGTRQSPIYTNLLCCNL